MPYVAVSLGLFILIFTYFTLNAPKVDPASRRPAVEVSQQSQGSTPPAFVNGYCQPVEGNAPTFRAPADNILKVGDDDIDYSAGRIITDPSHCGGNRNQIGDMTTYRLIRRNVPMTVNETKNDKGYLWDDSSCHFQSAQKLDISVEGVDTSKFKVYYPQISGEISLGQMMYSRTRNVDSSYMYFIDYGLVFLLHLNPDGSFVELRGNTMDGSGENFYLADVYQDSESGRPPIPAEALACDTSIASSGTSGPGPAQGPQVIQPGQDISQTKDQLQLQYFVFGTATTPQGTTTTQLVNGWGVHCKPAVYLYPKQKQLVNVKVFPKGELSYTDPIYDPAHGWTVEAFPNGDLTTTYNLSPITYPYLYYESKILDSEIKKPAKGWIVSGLREKNYELRENKEQFKSMEQLFNEILPKLGLNPKEQKDFSEYWLKQLPDSPYYFVGLIEKQQRDYLEALSVTPNPDTSIRFSLFFEMLDQPKTMEEPVIKTPARNGFTLVDWGGMVKLHPGTPFTCSQ